MEKSIEQYTIKHREIFLYIFFGVVTTVVNFAAYGMLKNFLGLNYLISNTVAWISSVVFAYITNRKYVFLSVEKTFKGIFKEFISFVGCRLFSGVFDMGAMIAGISVLSLDDCKAKILTNVGVVVMNYVLSKLVIFRKRSLKE